MRRAIVVAPQRSVPALPTHVEGRERESLAGEVLHVEANGRCHVMPLRLTRPEVVQQRRFATVVQTDDEHADVAPPKAKPFDERIEKTHVFARDGIRERCESIRPCSIIEPLPGYSRDGHTLDRCRSWCRTCERGSTKSTLPVNAGLTNAREKWHH